MQVHSSGFTLQFSHLVMFMLKEKLKEHKMELIEKNQEKLLEKWPNIE